MIFLRSAVDIRRLRGTDLSYPEVGATRNVMPPGYRQVRRRDLVGAGAAAYERGCEALATWQVHSGAGLTVTTSHRSAEVGSIVVLGLAWRHVGIYSPCRVVYLVKETTRQGFAYGTLPGHPERGEESFVIETTADGLVVFEVRAFSSPNSTLTRLGGPVSNRLQDAITQRYVRSLRRILKKC